jgi:hypothetical protein
MGTLALAPYNRYIFYAALAALAVYAVIFAVHLNAFLKNWKAQKKRIEVIQKNAGEASRKVNAMKAKSEKSAEAAKSWLPALLSLLAILKAYRQQDEKGVRGFRHAAASVLEKKAVKRTAMDYLKKAL